MAMKTALRLSLLASAVLVAGAAQAQLIIYKQPGFAGGDLPLRGDSSNLSSSGFTDQASSAVVQSGRWEVCTQPDFKGDCVTLDRGEYATLDPRINHRIESVRQVGRYVEDRGYGRGGGYGGRDASLALYSRPAFPGPSIEFDPREKSIEGTGFDRDPGPPSVLVTHGTLPLR